MPYCKRCGTPTPFTYCCHCKDQVYRLKRSWDATIYEFLDEIAGRMKTAFQEFEEKDSAPMPLELLAEAWYAQDELSKKHYRGQFANIYSDLVRADPREFPTKAEIAEMKGDDLYHEMADEGRL